MNWVIRSPQEQDIPFIFATWLRSFYSDNHYSYMTPVGPKSDIRKSIYFENYRKVIDHLLEHSDVDIACLKDTPEVILGYMISKPPLLHYCFVKDAFRHLGIAESMFDKRFKNESEEIECTHITKSTMPFLKKNILITFNPFKLYKGM